MRKSQAPLVNFICPLCGQERLKKRWRIRQLKSDLLCKSCSVTGELNPMFGKHPSPRTLKLMSESHTGQHHSLSGKGLDKLKAPKSIETKKRMSESQKKNEGRRNYGEANGSWKGGVSFLPYGSEFNKKLKAEIKFRDKNSCQICQVSGEEVQSPLAIHHRDENKQNNKPSNLITLCPSCHSKVTTGVLSL